MLFLERFLLKLSTLLFIAKFDSIIYIGWFLFFFLRWFKFNCDNPFFGIQRWLVSKWKIHFQSLINNKFINLYVVNLTKKIIFNLLKNNEIISLTQKNYWIHSDNGVGLWVPIGLTTNMIAKLRVLIFSFFTVGRENGEIQQHFGGMNLEDFWIWFWKWQNSGEVKTEQESEPEESAWSRRR